MCPPWSFPSKHHPPQQHRHRLRSRRPSSFGSICHALNGCAPHFRLQQNGSDSTRSCRALQPPHRRGRDQRRARKRRHSCTGPSDRELHRSMAAGVQLPDNGGVYDPGAEARRDCSDEFHGARQLAEESDWWCCCGGKSNQSLLAAQKNCSRY
jgi:hypothetical protein